MSVKPIISIIVPVYNVEPYLRRCLESIRNQTFKDFEVILINDASTDNCGKICDEYVKLDSRFQAIHKPVNEGLSAARNTGLEVVRGEYVGFIDSDDYIHPQMYETLHRRINADNYDIAMCDFVSTNSDHVEFKQIKDDIECDPLSVDDFILGPYWAILYSLVWNKLYRRDLIGGIAFQDVYPEDLYYNVQVLKRSPLTIHCHFDAVAYFRREDSLSHTIGANEVRRVENSLINYDDVCKMCSSDQTIFALLSKMLFLATYAKSLSIHKQYISKKEKVLKDFSDFITPHLNSFLHHSNVSQRDKCKVYILRLMFTFPILYRLFIPIYSRIYCFRAGHQN